MNAIFKKKGSPLERPNYRGVLAADHAAKTFTGHLRSLLLSSSKRVVGDAQRGGQAGLSVEFGTLTLRLLRERAARLGRCFGILFVKLRSAFDSVVRQLVVGIWSDEELAFVISTLGLQQARCSCLRNDPTSMDRYWSAPERRKT